MSEGFISAAVNEKKWAAWKVFQRIEYVFIAVLFTEISDIQTDPEKPKLDLIRNCF